MLADAKYLLGVSYPSSERQHVLTMKTLSNTRGVCADRATATDACNACFDVEDSKGSPVHAYLMAE